MTTLTLADLNNILHENLGTWETVFFWWHTRNPDFDFESPFITAASSQQGMIQVALHILGKSIKDDY